jgi:hypothetical protein
MVSDFFSLSTPLRKALFPFLTKRPVIGQDPEIDKCIERAASECVFFPPAQTPFQ